jgi:kinesin family protein 5
MNSIEKREKSEIVVDIADNQETVRVRGATGAEQAGFTFDRVFPMNTQQHEVFEYGVKECVYSLML